MGKVSGASWERVYVRKCLAQTAKEELSRPQGAVVLMVTSGFAVVVAFADVCGRRRCKDVEDEEAEEHAVSNAVYALEA